MDHPRLEAADKARSVLLELAVIFKEYHGMVIVVGGWAAHLLAEHCGEAGQINRHFGSFDVDLMLSAFDLESTDFSRIRRALLETGYESLERNDDEDRPFTFVRSVMASPPMKVELHLMTPKVPRHSRASVVERNGLWLKTLDAGALVQQFKRKLVLEGKLPDGRDAVAVVFVADFAPLLAMKGAAMRDRFALAENNYHRGKYQKHAYDISWVVRVCGAREVAHQVKLALAAGDEAPSDLRQSLDVIWQHFRQIDAGGPEAAAIARAGNDQASIPRYRNDAFFAMADFLEMLDYSIERPIGHST